MKRNLQASTATVEILRSPTSFRIDERLLKEMRHVTADLGITQIEVVEGALRMLFDVHKHLERTKKDLSAKEVLDVLNVESRQGTPAAPSNSEEASFVEWALAIYRTAHEDEASELIAEVVRKKGRRLQSEAKTPTPKKKG